MSLNHSPAIVTDGLVLCLDAANKRSYPQTGSVWSDLAGANNGTLNNMENNFDSASKGSLTFDGSNEYVELPDITNLLSDIQEFTVSMWVNLASVNTTQFIYGVCSENGFGDIAGVFEFNITSSAVVSFQASRFGSADQINLVTASANKWYHLCGRRSGTTQADGFLNGALVGSDTNIGANSNSVDNKHRIGRPNYDTRYFNGKTSGVLLYDRFLSNDEIRQNYEATVGRYV